MKRLFCVTFISLVCVAFIHATGDIRFIMQVNGSPSSCNVVLRDGDQFSIYPVSADDTSSPLQECTFSLTIYLIDSDGNEKWWKRTEASKALSATIVPELFEGVDLSRSSLIHDPDGLAYNEMLVKCEIIRDGKLVQAQDMPVRLELIPKKPLIQEVVIDSIHTELIPYSIEGEKPYWVTVRALAERCGNHAVLFSQDSVCYGYSRWLLDVTDGLIDTQVELFDTESFYISATNGYGQMNSDTLNMKDCLTGMDIPFSFDERIRIEEGRIVTSDGSAPDFVQVLNAKGAVVYQGRKNSSIPQIPGKGVYLLQVKLHNKKSQTLKYVVR